jgi:hypothetical protein
MNKHPVCAAVKTARHPVKRDFTASAISSTAGGFHPSVRTDFIEKTSFVGKQKTLFSCVSPRKSAPNHRKNA